MKLVLCPNATPNETGSKIPDIKWKNNLQKLNYLFENVLTEDAGFKSVGRTQKPHTGTLTVTYNEITKEFTVEYEDMQRMIIYDFTRALRGENPYNYKDKSYYNSKRQEWDDLLEYIIAGA